MKSPLTLRPSTAQLGDSDWSVSLSDCVIARIFSNRKWTLPLSNALEQCIALKKTRFKLAQPNASRTAVWTCFPLGRMPYQGDKDHIIQHQVFRRRSTSWPKEGGGHQRDTGAERHPGTLNIHWHSNLHGSFSPRFVCYASEKSPKERHWLPEVSSPQNSFQEHQAVDLPWGITNIIWSW